MAATTPLLESFIPAVLYHGLNTAKAATLGSTLAVDGAVTLASTLAVTGAATFSSSIAATGAITGKKNVVSGSGATVTLTAAQSGSVCLFDRAAGIVFTLPTAAAGLVFDFMVSVTITSNAAKVITAAGTELLVGTILNTDTDSSDAIASWKSLVATGNVAVSMDGSTKGGIKGDWLRFTCLSSIAWNVQGLTLGTGTVATPFATS